MYCDYYGFSEAPFNLTPDPNFLYMSQGHEEVLTSIIYGIQGRRGIMVLIGEVGTGKTTLLNTALEWLSQKTRVAYVINFDVNFEDLLKTAILKLNLGQTGENISKIDALNRLNEFALQQLAEGGSVVLIIDEAQNLNTETMENLRLLSNMETPKHKLVQIILSGQPELAAKLDLPELRQLAQRISMRKHIAPLKEKETYEYIQHRLEVADFNGPGLFSTGSQHLIWRYSEGVPRKINNLCDNALLIGFQMQAEKIRGSIIQRVVKELRWKPAGN